MEKKEAFPINIVLHMPEKETELAAIQRQIATLHAQFVFHYLDRLCCPLEQKRQLLEATAQTYLPPVRKKRKYRRKK